jgi:hypothetical protein
VLDAVRETLPDGATRMDVDAATGAVQAEATLPRVPTLELWAQTQHDTNSGDGSCKRREAAAPWRRLLVWAVAPAGQVLTARPDTARAERRFLPSASLCHVRACHAAVASALTRGALCQCCVTQLCVICHIGAAAAMPAHFRKQPVL